MTADELLPVATALDLALDGIGPLSPAELSLEAAYGCAAAEDVVADRFLPSFSSSGMDGFAVRANDVALASPESPVELRITGRVAMGKAPDLAVGSGEAVRIATGAPVPAGSDGVVPIELCEVFADARVLVRQGVPPGRYLRPAGQDVRPGEVLVREGRRLLGPELGLLALAGRDRVRVRPRPRVAILSTGDELVPPGAMAGFGQVHDANGPTLFGAAREAGAEPRLAGIVPDDADAFRDALGRAATDTDVLLSSGGVSAGELDVVKRTFEGRGEVAFHRVAMQPGMPQAFGRIDGIPFFGLPGNPVSVFVSFEVFVRPAILRMLGRRRIVRPAIRARVAGELRGQPEKTVFARVRAARNESGWTATSTGGPQSNLLATLSQANGLAVIPPGVERLGHGEVCRVMLFRDPEETT